MIDFDCIADKLLDMKPDVIPKFILLKEFKSYDQSSIEYQNLYEQVCEHPYIKQMKASQNERGFWPPFHGNSEYMIRLCLTYGLQDNHICLNKIADFLVEVLNNRESIDQYEKQDNPRWWPDIFVPLLCSSMLSLIRPDHEILAEHRKRWAGFAEAALTNVIYGKEENKRVQDGDLHFFYQSGTGKVSYNYEIDKKAQNDHFGMTTKRIIPPFNYYNFLLLAPHNGNNYISEQVDQALVDYCMNDAEGIYYVYNSKPGEMLPIASQNKDNRDFCHWIRALSLIAQFKGWTKYEDKYVQWIMEQRNSEGLWEYPKKYNLTGLPLSDSWRNKNNKMIDSTIKVLRLLKKARAF